MFFSCKSVVSNLHQDVDFHALFLQLQLHPFLADARYLMKSIKDAGTPSITSNELEISCRLKRLEKDIMFRHFVNFYVSLKQTNIYVMLKF